jgi:hypothetical protein
LRLVVDVPCLLSDAIAVPPTRPRPAENLPTTLIDTLGPRGVGKVDLRAMNEVRKLWEKPGLGAFRVRAALKQIGIHLSSATCGRILALNRRIYGLK